MRGSEDHIFLLSPCRRQESVGCRGRREKHRRQGRGSRLGVFLLLLSQWAWGPFLRVHTHHPPCFILNDCTEEADGGTRKLCESSTRAQWPLMTHKGRRLDYGLDGRLRPCHHIDHSRWSCMGRQETCFPKVEGDTFRKTGLQRQALQEGMEGGTPSREDRLFMTE